MSTPATGPARRSSIRRTLFVISLVLVLLPQMAVGIVGAMLGWQAQLQSTRDHLSAAADLKQAEIDRWIEERETDLSVLATDTAMQEFLHAMIQSPEESGSRVAAYSEVAVRLRSFLRKKVAFLELSLLDVESGLVVLSTDQHAEVESHLETTYFTRGKEASYLQPPVFDPAI